MSSILSFYDFQKLKTIMLFTWLSQTSFRSPYFDRVPSTQEKSGKSKFLKSWENARNSGNFSVNFLVLRESQEVCLSLPQYMFSH